MCGFIWIEVHSTHVYAELHTPTILYSIWIVSEWKRKQQKKPYASYQIERCYVNTHSIRWKWYIVKSNLKRERKKRRKLKIVEWKTTKVKNCVIYLNRTCSVFGNNWNSSSDRFHFRIKHKQQHQNLTDNRFSSYDK